MQIRAPDLRIFIKVRSFGQRTRLLKGGHSSDRILSMLLASHQKNLRGAMQKSMLGEFMKVCLAIYDEFQTEAPWPFEKEMQQEGDH